MASIVGADDADEAVAGLEPVLSISVVGTDTLVFEPAAFAVTAGNAIELTLHAEDAVEQDEAMPTGRSGRLALGDPG